MQAYHWPGNIRELENVVERGIINSVNGIFEINKNLFENGQPLCETKFLSLEEAMRSHILAALKKTRWRVSGPNGAALLLGLNPKTLESKIRKMKIIRPI